MARLPPLNAIKAFEATARLGSFTVAAAELGVSASAVSQQVRHLEQFLERQLFLRTGNHIQLTDAGRAVYLQASGALNALAGMTANILEGSLYSRRLIISLPFSLVESWFMPKLSALLKTCPAFSVDIRVEDDPVDIIRHDIDIRVSYGSWQYPGFAAVHLGCDTVIPVCSRQFWMEQGNDAFDLSRISPNFFIHTHWGEGYVSEPTWHDWFSANHSNYYPDPKQGMRSGLSSLSALLARQGLGIALGQKFIVRADLESGQLFSPSDAELSLAHAYYALMSEGKGKRKDIEQMLALLAEPL